MRFTISRPAVMQVMRFTSTPRRDFDHVHADHAPLLDEAVDQLAGLYEGDATRARAGDRRRDRRVHAVEVDGQIVSPAVGDALEDRFHADVRGARRP